MRLRNKSANLNLRSTSTGPTGLPRISRKQKMRCARSNRRKMGITWRRFDTQPVSFSTEEENHMSELALLGGRKTKSKPFPLWPQFDDKERGALNEVLDSRVSSITPRTKAIIAVHMGGHPADLDGLKEICQRHKLVLVEDSSHAHASEWRGQRIGTFGVAGTFSFQSSKLMTAGEGGIIISNDDNF